MQKIAETVSSSVSDLMQKLSDKLFFEAGRLDGAAVLNTAPTLAEQRAAKQLGLTAKGTAALCQLAYNQSLDEEAAQRAGEHATPQKRGRETRIIRSELESLLDYILETKDLPISWQSDYDDDSLRRADSMSIVNGTYTQPVEPDKFTVVADSDYLDLAAKRGDIEREQEAYEEMPGSTWRPSPVNGPTCTSWRCRQILRAATTRQTTAYSSATGSHQSNAGACSHMRLVMPVTTT